MTKIASVAVATKMARQGDVLVMRAGLPGSTLTAKTELGPAQKDRRGVVLAEGETSGHHHQVFGSGAKLFRYRGAENAARALVVGREGAELRVVGGESGGRPRHEPIALAGGAGKWEVRIQRSWTGEDEARSRQVAD